MSANQPVTSVPARPTGAGRRAIITRIAWLSILLGLVMEALLLLVRFSQMAELQPVAEALGKITWSLVVCTGLGFGKVVSDDKPLWTGLAGLVSAPIAFVSAQGVQKAVSEAVGAASGADPLSGAVLAVAALRGIEYMILGSVLALVARRGSRLLAYLVPSLVIGAVFGGLALLRTPSSAASLSGVLTWTVNELLFPLGCAAVLYAGESLSGVVEG